MNRRAFIASAVGAAVAPAANSPLTAAELGAMFSAIGKLPYRHYIKVPIPHWQIKVLRAIEREDFYAYAVSRLAIDRRVPFDSATMGTDTDPA